MASASQQTKTFWFEHIAHWQSTDLSQAAYCQQHELSVHQFSYWKRKLVVVEGPALKTSSSRFARVQVETASYQDSGLSLHFADGTRLAGIQHHNLVTVCQLIERLR